MMGPGYIADSLQAAAEKRARQESWQCYAGDVLRLLAIAWDAKNVPRYWDILHPKPEDTRTAEEIAADFVRRKGLKLKKRD